jgi:hypothetical protein
MAEEAEEATEEEAAATKEEVVTKEEAAINSFPPSVVGSCLFIGCRA